MVNLAGLRTFCQQWCCAVSPLQGNTPSMGSEPLQALLLGILGREVAATFRGLCQVMLLHCKARAVSWVDQDWIWAGLSVAVNHGQAEHKCRLSFPNPHPPWAHKPKQDVRVFIFLSTRVKFLQWLDSWYVSTPTEAEASRSSGQTSPH